jgi:hypothetical protein
MDLVVFPLGIGFVRNYVPKREVLFVKWYFRFEYFLFWFKERFLLKVIFEKRDMR